GDRVAVARRLKAAPCEEFFAVGLIEPQVIREATLRFFDIRTRLVEREREMIEGHDNIAGLVHLLIRGLILELRPAEKELRPLDEAHRLHFNGHPNRGDSTCAGREQNAAEAALREELAHKGKITGIIKE